MDQDSVQGAAMLKASAPPTIEIVRKPPYTMMVEIKWCGRFSWWSLIGDGRLLMPYATYISELHAIIKGAPY